MTDTQILEHIKQSGTARKKALRLIYLNWRKSAQAILLSSGANLVDVEDAIQEAIIVLDNSIRNGKFLHQGNLKNYFIGICKGRLYSNKRSIQKINWIDDPVKIDGIEIQRPDTLALEEEQKEIIQRMLNLLDKKCKSVLMYFKLSYSMQSIAEEEDLGNTNNARQWVFKCRKRLTALVSKSPFFINYFKDQQ